VNGAAPRQATSPSPPHRGRATGRGAGPASPPNVHQRIWALVAKIPRGRVATYGQLARLAGARTPRIAGYALAGIPDGHPWHRVINSQGEVSPRRRGDGHLTQRKLLEREGVRFDARGRIDLARYGWRASVR
jgi:methylated-DNA-protein-cysteine methyltransferase-like protein